MRAGGCLLTREETLERVQALLAGCHTMVLATVDGRGFPASAPLFYWSDGEPALYWLSSPSSAHSVNLAAHSEAAVSVFAPVEDWRDIRGIQMTGCGEPVADEQRARALESYRRRFNLGPEMDGVIASSILYVFRPRWLRYIDNSRGFGFRSEVEL